jgi:tagatose-6-phosphate ketose/aldose isomerase
MQSATLIEILQQPLMWSKTIDIINEKHSEFKKFIQTLGEPGEYDILFIGAGTSEYVGNSLVASLNPYYGGHVYSVPSTELVPYPNQYFSKVRKILAIHFGRSGNSPESIHSVRAIQHLNPAVYHVAITCNSEGNLSKISDLVSQSFVITLPEETHDQGFAMTSSFTSMTLAAFLLLAPKLGSLNLKKWLNEVETNMPTFINEAKKIVSSFDYDRLVVLGALESKGFAQESALKSLELSSGKVATLYDSPMGFRHGPKSFLNEKTLVLCFLRQAHQTYELDVIKEIAANKRKSQLYVLGSKIYGLEDHMFDFHPILMGLGRMPFTQLLAYYKSVSLGINPDSPSQDNEVNRVVTGVTLYPFESKS